MNTIYEDKELAQKLAEAQAAHKKMPVVEKTPKEDLTPAKIEEHKQAL